MITSIKIDNFKSLVDFHLPLAKFNCLVGLNGAGKSTVLQAFDFLSQLVKGDITGWLEKRQWSKTELNSALTKKSNIEFSVDLALSAGQLVKWSGCFNRNSLCCTRELVTVDGITILKVSNAKLTLRSASPASITFNYEASLLSQLKLAKNDHVLKEIKNAVSTIQSLDIISPELLKKSHKTPSGQLELGGEKLPSYIHQLSPNGKAQLKTLLRKIYHQLDEIETTTLRSGQIELSIIESFTGIKVKSNAQHINDGMLRLMAILSQLSGTDSLLLFDEIENGINPERIEYLVDLLTNSAQQILITTHSPMVLNFLEDGMARGSVIYLYKTPGGVTKACKLFDIPSLNQKLNLMGPGEAFIDTDQTELYKEISTA
jgi:predicted ATPase